MIPGFPRHDETLGNRPFNCYCEVFVILQELHGNQSRNNLVKKNYLFLAIVEV